MKNKLIMLKLALRNYSKNGKLFVGVFAFTLLGLSLLIPKISIHADPTDPEIIVSANANIMQPVGGNNPVTWATSSDDAKYSVMLASWNLEEGPDYPYLEPTDTFETGKDYTARVVFTANEGYAFDENTIFTINGGETTAYGEGGYRQRLFQDTPAPEGPEQVFSIDYDFNGGTKAGEGTYHEESVGVGMELSEESLINLLGVTAPADQVLNYITINDEPFDVGDGFMLDRNIVIKYFWREDTGVMYTVTFDPNGGTPTESYQVPPEVPAGQTFIFNAPDETQVVPPENKEFDAFEINGERRENGYVFTMNQNSTFKLLWRDIQSGGFNRNDYTTIEIGGGATSITEADGDDTTVMVTYEHGSVTILGTDLYSDTTPNGNGNYEVYALGDVAITATANENYTASLFDSGTRLDTLTQEYQNLTPGEYRRIDAEFSEEGQAPGQDYEDISFNLHWVGTYINVWINNREVMPESQDYTSPEFTFDDVVVNSAGYTDPAETNVIRLLSRFGDPVATEYTINGTVYNAENENVTVDDNDGSWLVTVPGSPTYTISGTGDSSIAVPRTIIWANVDADHNAENFEEDMLLEHGRAKVIAIYDGETQVAGETDVDETGMGWVQVTPGHQVVFEFVPEYGYQLTSVEANGLALEPQDTMNQYIFEMPDTNVHFSATFERTEDVLEANSEKITGGSIVLNGGLEGGSAQLTVNDVELSPDKIVGFENAAGDYTITSFLDIDLYNIFQKANADEDEVWSNKIDELDEEAVITIQLAEGIDASSIVIVHNIHDGEEYEIIEIDSYDPETNTITFRTKSFSNYAIATSDAIVPATDGSESSAASPETGAMPTESGSATAVIAGLFLAPILIVGFAVVRAEKKK